MKKSELSIAQVVGLALGQAVSASVFVALWATFITNAEKWFGPSEPGVDGILLVCIVFIVVATLSASSVLGYPLFLALQGKWGVAIRLVVLTVLWLCLIGVGIIIFR